MNPIDQPILQPQIKRSGTLESRATAAVEVERIELSDADVTALTAPLGAVAALGVRPADIERQSPKGIHLGE